MISIRDVSLLEVSGNVVAHAFRGDGSGLTHLPHGLSRGVINAEGDDVVMDASLEVRGNVRVTSGTIYGDGRGLDNIHARSVRFGKLHPDRVPTLDASKITSGVFEPHRIPALDAEHIESGVFHRDRIPLLHAAYVAGGVLDPSRIPSLNASKIVGGTVDIMRIPDIPASKIQSGVISEERIPKTLAEMTILHARTPGTLSVAGDQLRVQIDPERPQRVIWSHPESSCVEFRGEFRAYASFQSREIRFDPQHQVAIGAPLSVEGTISSAQSCSAQRFVGRGTDLTDLNASNVTAGILDGSLIGPLDASKIATGVLDPLRIPQISAEKVVGGTFQASMIPSLDASKITTGVLPEASIPRGIPVDASLIVGGPLKPSQIPPLDASYVAGGILNAARIPNLHGSKIIRGTLAPEQIPGLDASKITSGVVDPNRFPPLDASLIAKGTLSTERIPMLHASYITSGHFHPNRLPPLDASMIVGGVLDRARLPPGEAKDIVKGVFNVGRIPDLDASKITSGILSPKCLPFNIGDGTISVEGNGVGVVVGAPVYMKDASEAGGRKRIQDAVDVVRKMRGFISQNGVPGLEFVDDAFPEATLDGGDAINYQGLVPLLVEAIRQLADIISAPNITTV